MISVWQIYFDKQSRTALDQGFIPYDNTNNCSVFFENEVIIDIWKNQKNIWSNSEYIGVLSWQFKQKSGLNSSDIFKQIYIDKEKGVNKDIYLLTPKKYMAFVPTIHKTSFDSVVNVCKLIDKANIFPFLLNGENTGCKSFCNYWVCRPNIFNDYVQNYLLPLYEWMKYPKSDKLINQLHRVTPHKRCTPHTFIMESLFKYYVDYTKQTFAYIQNEKEVLKGYAFGKEFILT